MDYGRNTRYNVCKSKVTGRFARGGETGSMVQEACFMAQSLGWFCVGRGIARRSVCPGGRNGSKDLRSPTSGQAERTGCFDTLPALQTYQEFCVLKELARTAILSNGLTTLPGRKGSKAKSPFRKVQCCFISDLHRSKLAAACLVTDFRDFVGRFTSLQSAPSIESNEGR